MAAPRVVPLDASEYVISFAVVAITMHLVARLAARHGRGSRWQAFLGLPRAEGVVTLTQLRVKDRQFGVLAVGSQAPLPDETADGLTTLAVEIALALDGARLTEHLQALAYHDLLTGLANRVRFMERLTDGAARARSHGKQLAVLFLDVDDFKIMNDNLGDAAGDRLLCTIADRLRSCVREHDVVARLGGDEFTVLMHDVAGPDEAGAVAERIAQELRQPIHLKHRTLSVGASVGVALSDWAEAAAPARLRGVDPAADDDQVGDLLRAADLALSAAKARGKGQSAIFDPSMASQGAGSTGAG